MSRFLLSSLFFYLSFTLTGATRVDWWEGKVLLNTGEVIYGTLAYDPAFDVVLVAKSDNDEIKSFSASKVQSFEYYDDKFEVIRRYMSLNYVHPTSYRSKLFFELVLDGEVKLVRRELTLKRFYNLTTQSLDENFGGHIYFMYDGSEFINLKRFKKQILPLLVKDYREELDSFIKDEKLKLKNKEHQVMLIDYFNFLSDEKRRRMEYVFSLN